MAKPSITTRASKGAALSYSELDANFTNLQDATLTLTAGTGGTAVTADLNGNITLVAGTGVTLTGDNTAKTITINSSGGSSLDVDLIEVGQADTDDVVIQADTGQNKSIVLKASYPGAPSVASYVKVNAVGNIILFDDQVTIGNSTGNALLNFTDATWTIGGEIFGSSSELKLSAGTKPVYVFAPLRLRSYTTTTRDALTAATGMMIFNTTTSTFQGYNGSNWVDLG